MRYAGRRKFFRHRTRPGALENGSKEDAGSPNRHATLDPARRRIPEERRDCGNIVTAERTAAYPSSSIHIVEAAPTPTETTDGDERAEISVSVLAVNKGRAYGPPPFELCQVPSRLVFTNEVR